MLIKTALTSLSTPANRVIGVRGIFGWFDAAFNKYDDDRVKEVGINIVTVEDLDVN